VRETHRDIRRVVAIVAETFGFSGSDAVDFQCFHPMETHAAAYNLMEMDANVLVGGADVALGLAEELAMLWIKDLGLWKSGEAGSAPGGRSMLSAEPDVGAFRALVEDARLYWNLMDCWAIPKYAATRQAPTAARFGFDAAKPTPAALSALIQAT
jgi:hypothetical protein